MGTIAHAIMLVFLPALSDTGGLFAGAWLGKSTKLSPRHLAEEVR